MSLVSLVERADPEAALVALTMLNTLVKNATTDREKYGSIKRGAKALQSRVLSCEGGAAALEALGFRLDEAADAYVFGAGEPTERDAR